MEQVIAILVAVLLIWIVLKVAKAFVRIFLLLIIVGMFAAAYFLWLR